MPTPPASSGRSLAVLEPLRQQAEAKGWQDERLKVMVAEAIAYQAHGQTETAVQLLGGALALAEPGGFVRLFVDEGIPMARLLTEASARGILPDYIDTLLRAFRAAAHTREDRSDLPLALSAQPLVEPLSDRELEILQLIAQGLSNREISERLFLAVITVKGHNCATDCTTCSCWHSAHKCPQPTPGALQDPAKIRNAIRSSPDVAADVIGYSTGTNSQTGVIHHASLAYRHHPDHPRYCGRPVPAQPSTRMKWHIS